MGVGQDGRLLVLTCMLVCLRDRARKMAFHVNGQKGPFLAHARRVCVASHHTPHYYAGVMNTIHFGLVQCIVGETIHAIE